LKKDKVLKEEFNSRFNLPNLAEIFDNLRKGKHICPEDKELYYPLEQEYEAFNDLFRHLGFDLVRHPRNFYYFHSDIAFTPIARRASVFMFILIEHLASEGVMVEETLTSGSISIDSLPHEENSRYQRYMDEAGITVDNSINMLVRLGFAEFQGKDKFRFRAPVYRFIDLCLQVLEDREHDKMNNIDIESDSLSEKNMQGDFEKRGMIDD
jgi:chromosome condensin MukBEF MukE localization factor